MPRRTPQVRPDAEANKLVEENFGLAVKFTNEYRGPIERDDVFSMAMGGLMVASRKWEEGRNVPFSSYVYRAIRMGISNYYKAKLGPKRAGDQKLQRLPTSRREGEVVLVDKGALPDHEVAEVEYARRIASIGMEALSDREKFVVRARVIDGKSFVEIGAELGISYQGVQFSYHTAIQKCRERIEWAEAMDVKKRKDIEVDDLSCLAA